MSQIHFILTRPDRTMLLIQLAFNQSNSEATSSEDHQRYLMRAVNQAIENVMTNHSSAIVSPAPLSRSNSQIIRSSYQESRSSNNHARAMLSPASSRASQSLFHSLSSMIETPRRRTHPLTRQQSTNDLTAAATQSTSTEQSFNDAPHPSDTSNQSSLGDLVNDFLHDSIRQTVDEAYAGPPEDEEKEDNHQPVELPDCPAVSLPPVTPLSPTESAKDQSSSQDMETEDTRSLPRPPALQTSTSSASNDQSMDQSDDDKPPLSRALSEPQLTQEQARTQQFNQMMQDHVTHRDVSCDGCGEAPIRGVRYKCRQCDNFDFCSTCYLACPLVGNHTKEHTYRAFTSPRPDPLVRALEDFLVLVLHSGYISVRLIGGVANDADALAAIYHSMMGATHHQGTRPASKRAIEALEHLVVEGTIDQVCVFCQEQMAIGDEATLFPCGAQPHCYHTDCLMPWLKDHSNCPLCQKCIENVDEERLNGPLSTIDEHSPERSESN